MASPDKIKIGAYLTKSENEALRVVADELGVSASKAVAMSIMAMYDKVSKGAKVSLPLATRVESPPMPESPITKDEIQGMIDESIKAAIAVEAETLYQLLAEQAKQAKVEAGGDRKSENYQESLTEKIQEPINNPAKVEPPKPVKPETVEPTETPETIVPIEVEHETTNDTEPEPVKVEPVAVGHEYDPKKGFSHKEMSDVSGNKITTIRVAASNQDTKHGIDGHDYKYDKTERAWFRLDDCPEQPETNQPIEQPPTVEAVEAEPEKK